MKFLTSTTILLFVTLTNLLSQSNDWKYLRTSNTGVAGDYHHVIEIDQCNNKWTAGYEPFWSDGSVVRYDDSVWQCWSSFEGYIPDDRVNAIAFDNLDRVWVGTDEGIGLFDGVNWTQYTSANTPLPLDHIYGVAVDGENNLWATFGDVNITGGGVAKFDGTVWTIYEAGSSGLPSSEVDDIDIDSNGNIWIGSVVGLIKFDGFNWITYTNSNSDITYNSVMSLFVDEQDRVWVGFNSVVDMFDGVTWTHYTPSNTPMNNGADIFDIAVSGDQIVFANSVPGGSDALIVFDGTAWEYVPLPNWPISVTIDQDGNFWTCGIGHVSKWDGSELTVYNRFNTGLAENFNNDIFIDSQTRRWFANGNGGIQVFDCPLWEAYGPWNEGHFPIPIDYTTIGTSITETPSGDIWMSYDGVAGGVVQIPGGDVHSPQNWIVWENDNAGVNIQFIQHIVSDDEGNVWCALDGGGVSV
ncbi:MAG TPA: two-component regulator propeller domain-containing protein [Chitinophagales bacterium]|nr:two-component regulator propeller domain-containing protein [Chitinophagales bacterium]